MTEFKNRIVSELETPDTTPALLEGATPAELAEAIALFLDNKRGREIKIRSEEHTSELQSR